MFLYVVGNAIALTVLICMVIKSCQFETENQHNIQVLQAALKARDTTLELYCEIMKQLGIEIREDKRVLNERNAVPQTD